MAKQKAQTPVEKPASPPAPKPRAAAAEPKPRAKVKCPRCGSENTLAVSKQGDVQYRSCQVVVCRWRFKVQV